MGLSEGADGGGSSFASEENVGKWNSNHSSSGKNWSPDRSERHVQGDGSRRKLVRTTSEAMAESILLDVDPWTAWMYKPHSEIVTLAGVGLLVWASGAWPAEEHHLDSVANAKRGVWATVAVFLVYCLIQAPSTILVRPHPVFWRFIHGIAVVYLVFLTFLLFQNRDDARQLLKHLHPDLGVGLHERSYAADCRVYTPENSNKFSNVYIWGYENRANFTIVVTLDGHTVRVNTVFDEYVVAHTIGWWAKAIMIRNEPFLWCLSIAFEFCERSLIHMLANFQECWWDSFVLDVLICNWFGIWFGMKTVNYFDGKTYNWVGVSQQKSFYAKVRRTLGQFTPSYWDKDEWNALQGPWRFLQVLAMGVVILVVEIMGFFLKFILWVPPLNPLVSYRLAIWWLIANPAIREYNVFLQSSAPVKKLGAFCWLAICIAVMETLLCVKFGRGLFPDPVPRYVIWFWVLVTVGLGLFLGAWTYRNYQKSKQVSHEKSMKLKADKSM